MALSQGLYQKQLQKLSPQQIQLMKLLQVPTALLEERIKEEIEENPALEEAEDGHEIEDEIKDEFTDNDSEELELDGSADEYDNIDISEYVKEGDDEVGDYKLKDSNYPEIDENRVIPIKVERGFNELMLEQLGMLTIDEHQKKVALQIIGNLDDDGYLRREFSAIVLRRAQDLRRSEQRQGLLRVGHQARTIRLHTSAAAGMWSQTNAAPRVACSTAVWPLVGTAASCRPRRTAFRTEHGAPRVGIRPARAVGLAASIGKPCPGQAASHNRSFDEAFHDCAVEVEFRVRAGVVGVDAIHQVGDADQKLWAHQHEHEAASDLRAQDVLLLLDDARHDVTRGFGRGHGARVLVLARCVHHRRAHPRQEHVDHADAFVKVLCG